MHAVDRATATVTIVIFVLIVFATQTPRSATTLGRPVWHHPKRLFDFEQDGIGTSQQVFDIYSFSHITHGILLYFVARALGFKGASLVYAAIIIEVAWEIIENTPFVMSRFRRRKEYKNFKGDSVVNVLGDVLCAVLGVYFASKAPKAAIASAIVGELVLWQFRAGLLQLSIGSLL